MKIKIFLLYCWLSTTIISPQGKYFIYFNDKGVLENYPLLKTSELYKSALSELSEKSIERRSKHNPLEIISYEDLPIKEEYLLYLNQLGIKIKHQLKWFNCVSAFVPENKLIDIKSLPFVKKIEPVRRYSFKKSDGIFNGNKNLNDYGSSFIQLNLSKIPYVHEKGITGKNVLIGVLDTGFDWKRHDALKTRNIIAEYDFIKKDSITANQPGDAPNQDTHGTYVLSIIAGYKDSVMIGSAFNSSFLLAKTENIESETNIEEDDYAAAIIWMENSGVDITTSSLGYSEFDPGNRSYTYRDMDGKTTIVARALNFAYKKGVSTFTSAGNEGNSSWKYIISPADAFNVIAVGAVTSQNQLASFSSIGPTSDGRIKPEVVAMGVSVIGALSGTSNQYITASGTSAAAPIAAGVGALLLSKFPYLKNYQIRNIILESSLNSSNPNNHIGYGLILAKDAIEFPNLEEKNNSFILNKIIFDENIIPNKTKLFLSINERDFQEFTYSLFSEHNYQFQLPSLNIGDKLKFYFTIEDSSGNIKRIPQNKNYFNEYGNLNIQLNIVQKHIPYSRISEIFPNPFNPVDNKVVRINFKSLGNELVKVNIIDVSGQKVKEFSFLSRIGENIIEWDGISENAFLCASGVYYFLITINEEKFGKKLILVK
jgi:hypothetical protein